MPKIVNHDEYREKILEKSLSLFTRRGYFNINMRQLAAEIDVSTGTLYNYFPSKKDILAAMIAWIGNKNVDEYIHLTSSVEKIHDRFDIVVDYLKEKGELHENIMLLAIDHFRNTDITGIELLFYVGKTTMDFRHKKNRLPRGGNGHRIKRKSQNAR